MSLASMSNRGIIDNASPLQIKIEEPFDPWIKFSKDLNSLGIDD